MVALIDTLRHGVPAALTELITPGRTLTKSAADVLAYFDRPGTSNRPTEPINGRLEHLRGSALGFRNLTNYIARCLLETGGFRPDYALDRDEPVCGQASAGIVTPPSLLELRHGGASAVPLSASELGSRGHACLGRVRPVRVQAGR